MENEWISVARKLPEPVSYFQGRKLPENFLLPESILLYFHDYPHEKTIISTRYMLIIPVVSMKYLINGREFFLNPGEALLVKPYLQRSVPEKENPVCTRLIVSFEAPYGQDYLPSQELFRVTEAATKLILDLVRFYLDGNTVGAIFALTMLLYELGKSRSERPGIQPSALIAGVLARINSNLVRPLSIKEIAQEAGLSASHLRRRFREEMGVSLGEYLAEQRLAGAKILLENTTQPIGEVARQCGYESIYAFCRFFRKRSGISPGKYRKFRENNRGLAEVF